MQCCAYIHRVKIRKGMLYKYMYIYAQSISLRRKVLTTKKMGKTKGCYRMDGQYSNLRHNHPSINIIDISFTHLPADKVIRLQTEGGGRRKGSYPSPRRC